MADPIMKYEDFIEEDKTFDDISKDIKKTDDELRELANNMKKYLRALGLL